MTRVPPSAARAAASSAWTRIGLPALRWTGLAFVLFYFNALFTFENVTTTPWIRLVPRLSVELVLGLFLIALYRARGTRLGLVSKLLVAGGILVAALVRYVDVTAPGVMGREFNVHSDMPHVHRVAAMFWEALPLDTALLILAASALVATLLVVFNWVGLVVLERTLVRPAVRRATFATTACALPLLVYSLLAAPGVRAPVLAPSVFTILAKQVGFVTEGKALERLDSSDLLGSRPGWVGGSDLERLAGADIILVFLESYGSTLIDDAHHYDAIAPRLERLEESLARGGYSFVSSQIISPAFAGGSWRAHATLLSGVSLPNEHFYRTLLRSRRPTLVHLLDAAGYRTVAAEPGIQREWPEGEFFGFDEIYDAAALDYHGAEIGWWKIPDQYTLYKIWREELRPADRPPVFAKIVLIMSHIPYFPIPPHVEDWSRFDDRSAYARSLPSIAADDYRDLQELSSRYVAAFEYEFDILEDFLLDFVAANALVIVAGDHQPPKLVTHDNDSWAVPIHLLSRRRDLIVPFYRYGFRDGLVPHHRSELRMEDFLPAFLESFHSGSEPVLAGD